MRIVLLFLLFIFNCALSAQNDTTYILKFLSSEDSSLQPGVNVHLVKGGIYKKDWKADGNASLKFRSSISPGNFSLRIESTEFKTLLLDKAALKVNDTTVVRLKEHIMVLCEMEILEYKVPYIEDKRKYYKNTKTGQLYSEEQLEAFRVLAKGKWYKKEIKRRPGLMKPDTLQRYLRRNIRYPQLSKDLDEEGRIVMNFGIDKDGLSRDIALVEGDSPILALEVAMVIAQMPKWTNFHYSFEPQQNIKRFQLSVKFILK